jgi:hypothetical protein
MARIVSYAIAGVPNEIMGEGPIPASKLALKKAGLTLGQMDVIEANEAFAAQARNDNIDFFHVYQACQCIEQWFNKTAARRDDREVMGVAGDLDAYLRSRVYVIWYDAGNEDSITLFTRLNVGRIALTNAELVKALLLSGKGDTLANQYRQIEIATQWDMIEQALQDDAFWSFLTNLPASGYPARIELIFDLLANNGAGKKDRFFTFEYFKERLDEQSNKDAGAAAKPDDEQKTGQLAVWAPVLEQYHLLREWFENRDLYHNIGYLVAAGDVLAELVAKATADPAPTKSGFLQLIDTRISDRLGLDETTARGLDYENRYKQCERLLLLFNVESVRLLEHSSERYPFDSHKREHWSLEHIHAQNAEPLKTEREWRAWLADAARALGALSRMEDQSREDAKAALVNEINQVLESGQGRVTRKDFDLLSRRVTGDFLNAAGTDGEEHSIANLAMRLSS